MVVRKSGLYPLYNNYYSVFIVWLCITITGWWCKHTILKNDGVRQWLVDDIPYMKSKIKNVWNHQPDGGSLCVFIMVHVHNATMIHQLLP